MLDGRALAARRRYMMNIRDRAQTSSGWAQARLHVLGLDATNRGANDRKDRNRNSALTKNLSAQVMLLLFVKPLFVKPLRRGQLEEGARDRSRERRSA